MEVSRLMATQPRAESVMRIPAEQVSGSRIPGWSQVRARQAVSARTLLQARVSGHGFVAMFPVRKAREKPRGWPDHRVTLAQAESQIVPLQSRSHQLQ